MVKGILYYTEEILTVIGWGLPRVAAAVACIAAVEPQPLGRR